MKMAVNSVKHDKCKIVDSTVQIIMPIPVRVWSHSQYNQTVS